MKFSNDSSFLHNKFLDKDNEQKKRGRVRSIFFFYPLLFVFLQKWLTTIFIKKRQKSSILSVFSKNQRSDLVRIKDEIVSSMSGLIRKPIRLFFKKESFKFSNLLVSRYNTLSSFFIFSLSKWIFSFYQKLYYLYLVFYKKAKNDYSFKEWFLGIWLRSY